MQIRIKIIISIAVLVLIIEIAFLSFKILGTEYSAVSKINEYTMKTWGYDVSKYNVTQEHLTIHSSRLVLFVRLIDLTYSASTPIYYIEVYIDVFSGVITIAQIATYL